jgi:4-amino-4-deoxy-L-arabinose transferase-like glycosyltransferase
MRPLLPVDETRYAAVAWEMWLRGDFLVPFRNGAPYPHKPPLLFWLIHAGWLVFGVNEWWPRLISPAFAAGTLAITAALGRALFPAQRDVARTAPFILLSSLLFAYFAAALMFDAMLTFFVALGWLGLVRAWRGAPWRGFACYALGIGGALYAKGPVALVHLLPAALAAPWWMTEARPDWRRWCAGVVLGVLGGAALILAWAIPAAIDGGAAYREAIFWKQSAGRMAESFAHRAPWWWYLPVLPALLAPWLLWPRWWPGLRSAARRDAGLRFAMLGLAVGLVFFSSISGKRWHYLLPEFPLFALVVARGLAWAVPPRRTSLALPAASMIVAAAAAIVAALRLRAMGIEHWLALGLGAGVALACGATLLLLRPREAPLDARRIATAAVLAAFALLVGFDRAMRELYDTSAVAARLSRYEREGRPLAFEGTYHGDWTFAGRLTRPLEQVPPREMADWLASHPGGRLVVTFRERSELPTQAHVEYERRYRGSNVAILAPR